MRKISGLLVLFTITGVLFFSFFNHVVLAIDASFTISLLPPTELIEGQGNFIFVLRRTGNLSGVTVFYKMSGSAASGKDYSAPPGSAQFSQGQETFNVSVPTVNDAVPENDETVTMTIIASPIAGSYQIGTPAAASATLKDDEPVLTLTPEGSLFELAGSISVTPNGFKISRTGSTVSALQVDIQIAGTATNGTDYNLISTPVQIAQNSSQVIVSVGVKDDLVKDPGETVTISIVPNSQRYRLGSPTSGTLTIQDNDPPKISLSISDANAEESNLSTATVQVVRTGDAQEAVTVNYTVNPANALIVGTPATSGVDFVALSGSVVVPRFRTSANIVITPLDDSLVEGTEKVLIHLSPSAVYDFGGNRDETLSILDNDFPLVTVTTADGIASESGPDPGTFSFSRTGDTTSNLTIRFSLATGANQATRNVDYAFPIRIVSNTVTIPSGQNTLAVAITPIDDSQQESQEQVTLSILQDAAYVVGSSNTATIFIGDND